MSGLDHVGSDTTRRGLLSAGNNDKISLTARQIDHKINFRALVEAVGGFEAAENFCRIGKSHLHRCCDRNTFDFAPIDVVHDLEDRARSHPDWPHVTGHSARLLGLTMIAMPDVGEVTGETLIGALAAASREHSDVATTLLEALGDGKVTVAEAVAVSRECTGSAEAALRLKALVDLRIKEG